MPEGLEQPFGALHEGYDFTFAPEVAYVRQGNKVCFFTGGQELTESVVDGTDTVVESLDELELVERDGTKVVKDGKWVVEGPFQRSDVENANKRRYPRKIWERIFGDPQSRQQQTIRARGMIGHLEHPKDGRTDGKEGAIVVTEGTLRRDGVVWGKAEILDTPNGLILQEYTRKHVRWGVSSRGNGSVDSDGKVNENDYDLETFDAVMRPSTPGAYPLPVKGVPSTREGIEEEAGEEVDEAADLEAWTIAHGYRDAEGSKEAAIKHNNTIIVKHQKSVAATTHMPLANRDAKRLLAQHKRVHKELLKMDEADRPVTEAWDADGIKGLASSGYGTGSRDHFHVSAKHKAGGKVGVTLHVLGKKHPEFVGTPAEAAAHVNKHLPAVAGKAAPRYHAESDTVSLPGAEDCLSEVDDLLSTPYEDLSEDAEARLIGGMLKRFGQVAAHRAKGSLPKGRADDATRAMQDRLMDVYRAVNARAKASRAIDEGVQEGSRRSDRDEAFERLVRSLRDRVNESRGEVDQLRAELEVERGRRQSAEAELSKARKLKRAAVERLADTSEKLEDAEGRLAVATSFITEGSRDEADSPVTAAVRAAVSQNPKLAKFRYVLERAESVEEVGRMARDLADTAAAETSAYGTAASLSVRGTLPNRLIVESGPVDRRRTEGASAPSSRQVAAVGKALKLLGTGASLTRGP